MRHLLCSATLALAAATASAATYRVPQNAATIQQAVDSAKNDDTIVISSGTFTEDVVVDTLPGVTIKGSKGTVLMGSVTIRNSPGVTLDRLVMRGDRTFFIDIADSADATVRDCDVEGTATRGIQLDGCRASEVVGCTVTGAAHAITIRDNPGGGRIENCKVTRSTIQAIHTDGAGTEVARCTLTECLGDGIRTNGSSSPVENCDVIGVEGYGIETNGADSPVLRCTVRDAQSVGIQTHGARGRVERSTATGLRSDPAPLTHIGIRTTGQESPIVKCTASAWDGNLMRTTGADSGIVKCKGFDGAGDGFESTGVRSDIDRCKIAGIAGTALSAYGNDCRIVRCKVKSAGGRGIELYGSFSLVERCSVVKGDGTGIVVAGFESTAAKCKIAKLGGDGMVIEGEGCTISKNKVSRVMRRGVVVAGDDNEITRNKASKSDEFDLFEEEGRAGNAYSKNKYKTSNLE